MKYGMIGRSHLTNLAEHITNHEKLFFAFGVPLQGYFNDPAAKITHGCLASDRRANYFARFNIEKFLEEQRPDFVLIDLYGSIKEDLFYDESGNVITGELSLYERELDELRRDYSWISIEDTRYFKLIEQSLHRLAWVMNSRFPDIKIIISEFFPVNSFDEADTGSFAPFELDPRFGAEDDYFNLANVRLDYASYLGRFLSAHVNNSAVLRAPTTTSSKPPFVISPTHFATRDYERIASEIDWHLASPKGSKGVAHDQGFSMMTYAFRSHRATMAMADRMIWQFANLEEKIAAVQSSLDALRGPEDKPEDKPADKPEE